MADKKNKEAIKYFVGQGDPDLDPEALKQFQATSLAVRERYPEANVGLNPTAGGIELASSPEDISAVDPTAISRYLDSLREQENPFSSEKTRDAVSKYRSKQDEEVNFTPLAALFDKWSGKGNGSQLTVAAKTLLDNDVRNKDLIREEERNKRQDKAQSFQLSKDFNNDLRRDIKNLEETLRIANPVRAALTPDANGRVNVQRVQSAITNAGRLLGNIGVQTENDAARTQINTLSLMLGKLETQLLNDPNASVDAGQVANLLQAIEDAVDGQRQAASDKIKLTRDAYVVGRGLNAGQADSVQNLYQSLTDKARKDGYEQTSGSAAPANKSAAPPQEDARAKRLRVIKEIQAKRKKNN